MNWRRNGWLILVSLLLLAAFWLTVKSSKPADRHAIEENVHSTPHRRQPQVLPVGSANSLDPAMPADVPAKFPDLPATDLQPPPRDFVQNELLADPAFRNQLLAEIRQHRRVEIAEFHKPWLDLQGLAADKRQVLIDQLLDYEIQHVEKMMPISKGGAFPAPPSMDELARDRREFIARLRHLFGEAVAASYNANFPGPGWTPNSAK